MIDGKQNQKLIGTYPIRIVLKDDKGAERKYDTEIVIEKYKPPIDEQEEEEEAAKAQDDDEIEKFKEVKAKIANIDNLGVLTVEFSEAIQNLT